MSKLIEVYIETYSNDPEFIAEEIMLAFGEKEYQLMQKEGVTKKELSKRTGLSTATLRKVLNDYNPNVKGY
jgi:predicted transcriptional regulator